ncbi:hypothetical protein GCM10009425_48300 [Pseudomonas asuensis]|uniref:Uncharacterized protein n=1 Tax=Pseudomonas asuensis TaxID=1825787 RepID=A0ABQ2H4L1_9PSED|nr:hypothetical protein [Pseudomonas asuensis]GGM32078.1 hypothetical protein GCM10009425_48300 [Pseudomonas asuensis]
MLIVDPATGGMFKFPEDASADMGQPVAQASKNKMVVMTLDQIPENLRSSLVQVR